jgi:acylpyruvate hydrolase
VIIRNLWCVGRNYADHAKELGNDLPKKPLIFLKAGTSTLQSGFPLFLPKWSKDVHHEVELALQFGDNLKIHRACVALDLTLRDIQTELKAAAQPWTLAKSFKNATPLGNFFDWDPEMDLRIRVAINGETRQETSTRHMIFNIPHLAEYVCEHFPVTAGDLLLTGTPQGVGPILEGDEIIAEAVTLHDGKDDVLSAGQWTATFA